MDAVGAAGRAACLAIVPALFGCSYLRERAADLGDVVSIQAGTGLGLHAEVHATECIRLDSGGRWDGLDWGITEGNRYSVRRRAFGVPIFDAFSEIERDEDVRASDPNELVPGTNYHSVLLHPFHSSHFSGSFGEPIFCKIPLLKRALHDLPAGSASAERLSWTERFHVGGQLDAGLVGAGAGADLFEILDFAAGIAGLDPSRDDDRSARPGVSERAAFLDAAERGDRVACERMLSARPALLSSRRRDGRTALHLAAETGDAGIAGALLDAGADPAERDDEGYAPLHTAAGRGNEGVVAALLAGGAPVDDLVFPAFPWVEPVGQTPLHVAAAGGHVGTIRILLAAGADVHARANGMDPALHLALGIGFDLSCPSPVADDPALIPIPKASPFNIGAADLLLHAGAGIDEQNWCGMTALHRAAADGDIRLVRFLLSRGANPWIRDGMGKTPRDLAEANGHAEAARLLWLQGTACREAEGARQRAASAARGAGFWRGERSSVAYTISSPSWVEALARTFPSREITRLKP